MVVLTALTRKSAGRVTRLVPRLRHLGRALFAVGLIVNSEFAFAQPDESAFVHWAYSAFFGTGWYDLGEQETAFALSYGPSWQLREAFLSGDGKRTVGVELSLLLSASVHEFELSNIPGIDNVSTLSAVPGIEVEIPITAAWSLKPVAHVGWGSKLGGGSSSWIYWTGLKSRYELPSARLEWALINSVYYVGYTPDSGPSGAISPVMTGLEIDQRFGDVAFGGDAVFLRWHGAYTRFHEFDLSPESFGRTRLDVQDEWELGVALHKADKPLEFWFLKWDQIGIAYRFNTEHSIKALNITFRALFDR
jgi:hypothetical protein